MPRISHNDISGLNFRQKYKTANIANEDNNVLNITFVLGQKWECFPTRIKANKAIVNSL